jgi:hypothetical protein
MIRTIMHDGCTRDILLFPFCPVYSNYYYYYYYIVIIIITFKIIIGMLLMEIH